MLCRKESERMTRKKYISLTGLAVITASAVVLMGCEEEEEGGSVSCDEVGSDVRNLEEAKLYFEYNSTDDDTGIHGMFDSSGWSELCVFSPDGTPFLAVKPQGPLGEHTMGGIFFESREPPADEMSHEEVLAAFPEGEYDVVGKAFDGASYQGTATVTHDIPRPAVITYPSEGEVVDPADLVITWDPVTDTVTGDPVTILGYEIIVTNEGKEGDDPHGMSLPVASVHVIPSVSSLTMPPEFLEPATEYDGVRARGHRDRGERQPDDHSRLLQHAVGTPLRTGFPSRSDRRRRSRCPGSRAGGDSWCRSCCRCRSGTRPCPSACPRSRRRR
jgi:hypothetical protein